MQNISSESLFDLKNVSQPLVVEDRIFYLETRTDQKKNTYLSSLWCLDRTSKERRLWVDEQLNPSDIKVSPNQNWLSFLAKGQGEQAKSQIYLMPMNGGTAFTLTDEKEGVRSYEWTSNSAAIYYQTSTAVKNSPTDGDAGEKSDKEKNRRVQPVNISKLQYKMDGQGITETERKHAVRRISIAKRDVSDVLVMDRPFRLQYVSRDESYLLYADKLDPENEWVYGASVYEYDIAKETARLITQSVPEGSFSFEAVNDKEDFFLFSGNDFSYAFVTLNSIYGWDRQTDTFRCLSVADKYAGDLIIGDFQQKTKGFPVKWLDNESFVYPVTEKGKLLIYKGHVDGTTACLFDQPLHITDGDLLEENNFAVTYSDLTTPSVLAELNAVDGQLEVLYDPNRQQTAELDLAPVERFWYKGADDWDIQGWYVKPLDAKDGHPAVLYIHGGPQVCYGETFFHEMQQLAAEGYGVIMLNPRGGNGYGQEFVASILGDYGNKDYEDLMLGTDHVLSVHPEIDKNQLFVAGGSYGGFMTNWIVGRTDRFKAAVTQRCISNWISFYGTSDVGAFFVEFQLKRDLSSMHELWGMSPLAHAAKVKTPILIIHGQEDLRCPQEQAEQMYTAMKKHGVETKMVLYPQSSHGLSREGLPHLRVERLNEVRSWLDQYCT
ncbi:Acylamino-acid-releasing enzyme [Alkalibacterium sp. AK22]|uniref:alpha/beta hydrolase family protein n=1 Tax=Alkalibacterium sp. AK22 TaxID=1229520 RepID=UPI000452F997|nr:S9 family peptidase [Alkalibacterium sp. AK22]EXJ23448.1 Acylamino-acid-releasing enzyme [Alkalibacterium sp. AK22]